jgi:subtilase family protein/putative Ig domain-containing protein
MSCASFIAGGFALLALLPATAVDSAVLARQKPAARAAGGPQLMAFGGRSAEQRLSPNGAKLDAALADLTRHLPRVRREHALEDLHALSPAARFAHAAGGAGPLVAIDAVTRGDPARLKHALVGLGLEHPAVFANDVGGWLPVDRIEAATALGELAAVRASMPHARAVVTSQGDFAQGSSVLRANNTGLTGAGVTVGIISDSFDCYGVYDKPGSGVPATTPNKTGYAEFGFATDDATFDKANGYLPSSVSVLEEGACMQYNYPGYPAYFLPFADEGRGMMQIVHDVAPGAALAFHTGANSEADFASGIGALAAAGATVIADDLGYYDEPFFQDGIVAQAIDQVNAKGVAYFSAAGNNGQLSYENSAPSFPTTGTGVNAGEMLLTFGTSATPWKLPVNIPVMYPGEFIALIVEWDQPFLTGAPGSPGASSQIDLCVTGTSAGSVVFNLDLTAETCTGPNAQGVDPVQVLILGNSAANNSNTAAQTVNIVIGLKNGSPQPGLIKVVVADDGAGSTIDSTLATNSPTIQGHPGAAGAAAVAAAFFAQTPRCGTSPAVLEYFSSAGGDPILFDTSGTRLAAPQQRQKPDFTGPDGVNTSFFGFPLAGSGWSDTSTVAGCQNDATYNNFFGTSAATPHAAGIAALMQQAIPTLTPTQIYFALQSTALPMTVGGNPSPDYLSGYGFIQADAAFAPIVELSSSTIYLSQSSTLTWLAINSTSCTAMGNWSGNPSPGGGSRVETPTATGTYTYTLTCNSAAGTEQSSANLVVQPVPPFSITSASLPNGQVGVAYQAVLTATGGIPPYTWSIAGGALPTGLSLNAATGTISGTPMAAVSSSNLTIRATDSEKAAQTSNTSLSLNIAAAPSSGGGGGGLDALTLLAMIVLGGARLLRASRRGLTIRIS